MQLLLGNNIRLIRKKWRYKQEEFGALFQIKGQSISTYEKETAEPKIRFLMQLSQMTGITINDLCTKLINEHEIPEKPLHTPQVPSSSLSSEPTVNYESLRPEDISEPLYNNHILVSEFKKLRSRVEDLEKRFGQEEE